MSDEPSKQEPSGTKRSRARDFVTLTLGAVGVLALLGLTGAIGLVEFVMAAIVMVAGAMAFYVGSIPHARPAPEPAILQSARPDSKPEISEAINPFILSLPFAALLIDTEGKIAAANAHARKVFRIAEDKQDLLMSALRQPELLNAASRVSSTKAGEIVEFTLNSETETWMAHMQAGPDLGTVVIVFEDMTAVRRAERARADFLANASHELRTPLTAVGGFIETMRGPAKNDKDSWNGFLEIMHQQTERMKRLVTDLLSLSRIEFSEHRAPSTILELTSTAQRASIGLQPIAQEAGVRLHVDYPDRELRAIADADEMIQVLQNLAGNALKYAPRDGEVQIIVGAEETMSGAAIMASRSLADAKRAVLLTPRASTEVPAIWMRVTDNGAGIPEQHLPRLGERFYRVDESRGGQIEGTGLGLAIVKHIMARHRGGFAVESIEGQGTAFGVWLPMAADAA